MGNNNTVIATGGDHNNVDNTQPQQRGRVRRPAAIAIAPRNTYDICVAIDSLETLATGDGWPIHFYNRAAQELPAWSGPAVAVVGNFNRGKTYLLGQLSGMRFNTEGFVTHTEGICVKRATIGEANAQRDVIFLDTAGLQSPISVVADHVETSFQSQKRTEKFIQDNVIQLCDYILIVINEFG